MFSSVAKSTQWKHNLWFINIAVQCKGGGGGGGGGDGIQCLVFTLDITRNLVIYFLPFYVSMIIPIITNLLCLFFTSDLKF